MTIRLILVVIAFFLPTAVVLGDCLKFYTVQSGDYCYAIGQTFNITVAQLQSYNPSMSCTDLQIGDNICIFPGQSAVGELGYVGVDAPNGDMYTVSADSSLSCALACDKDTDCVAWAWSYPGSGCTSYVDTCWLKNANLGTRVQDSCRELGYKQGTLGVDRSGGDLPGMPLILGGGQATGASECALACKTTSGCVAWSFDSCGGQNCWLKSTLTGSALNTCRRSAVQGNLNLDLSGSDMQGSPYALASDATPGDCSDLCSSTPGCNSWAFVQPGPSCGTVNNCWLKTASPPINSGVAQSCRVSLSQPGVSPNPPPNQLCSTGNICHFNKCPFTANIVQSGNGIAAFQACSLATGESCTTNVAQGWAGNFKIGWSGQSLAEIQINGYSNVDYYDISYIVGFDYGMIIQPTNGAHVLDCPQYACADAYHYPNDVETHTTATGGSFIVTWCP